MISTGKRRKALLRDVPIARHIPYQGHLTSSIVDTASGDCVCVLRLAGAAFECADDFVINIRHDRLNRILMSLADPRVTLWQHVLRREDRRYPEGEYPPGYAREFNERYKAKICNEELMLNELYLSVVLRPHVGAAKRVFASLFKNPRPEAVRKARQEQVGELERIMTELITALSYYEAEPLAVYERNGVFFSETSEFFNFLITGTWERVPLAPVPLCSLIGNVRPFFGNETVEIRGPSSSQFGAMLGINAYPSETNPIFLDELLTLPFEFVITQSFEFHSKDAALLSMKMKSNRMENVGDAAQSQIDEIPDLADDLVSHRTVFGGHHFGMFVRSNNLASLNKNIADARRVLIDAGIKPAREDLAVEAAFWAQLPGNLSMRPRVSPINSRNLCGFAPLHNFPTGRFSGNHWGSAIAMLLTAAKTPHFLNLHAADPQAKSGGNKKDVGHSLLLGPNGSGKTAAVCFLLAMLQKFGVTSVLFSKDRDSEILVRRLRGKVFRLGLNQPSGLAPFSLDPIIPGNVRHLQLLLRKLVSRPSVSENGIEIETRPLSIQEEKELDRSIGQVLAMPANTRRLGRILDFLPKGELYDRLARWCYSREAGRADGALAWVFDNDAPLIANELGSTLTTVFDTTSFLDDPELRAPITLHLFHLTQSLIDGRRLAVFFSEFWKALGDRDFSAFIKDLLKTLRKKNGFVVLDSQSPSDALTHPLARTLMEQIATMFLFPNPGADASEHKDGLGLSAREFNLIKTDLPEGAGLFLLKQGRHSVVLRLALEGMADDLAVLSARTSNLALMDSLIDQFGEDPDSWAPLFDAKRRAA